MHYLVCLAKSSRTSVVPTGVSTNLPRRAGRPSVFPPGPRDYERSAESLNDIDLVQNDTELFSSAVSVFPVLDSAKLQDQKRKEFGPYHYVRKPRTASLPSGESKGSMSEYF